MYLICYIKVTVNTYEKTNINVNDKQTTRKVSSFSAQYIAFVYQLKVIQMCFYGFRFTRNGYDVHNIGTQFQR